MAVKSSYRTCPSFAHKYKTQVEEAGNGKHSSSSQNNNNYCTKKFYGTYPFGSWVYWGLLPCWANNTKPG